MDKTLEAHALILDGNGRASEVYGDSAVSLKVGNCCFWQLLDYRSETVRPLLVNEYHLDSSVVDALCDEDTRPRSFSTHNGMALILRGVNLNPGSNPEAMVSVRIWLDDKKLITLSHHPLKSAQEITDSLLQGKGPRTTADCFIALAAKINDNIAAVVNDISDATDDLEEKVIDTDNLSDFQLRSAISSLRRKIISIRRYAAPQKEIFQNLYNEKNPLFNTKNKSELREISNSLIKTLEDLDYDKDHLSVSHEELQSKMSLNMNKIMYMISIVTVIFMPLGLITSLLGINVEGIPYAESPYAFLTVCGILIVLCILLVIVMKKLKWL